jgi:hypothetical protein
MQLPSKGGRIADPVHGYVNFTRLERVIFQQKVAQRLRYICQNGLAYLIFPEAKSSRFAHSLGAMHLLSGALSSSFRNTDGAVRQALLNGRWRGWQSGQGRWLPERKYSDRFRVRRANVCEPGRSDRAGSSPCCLLP